MANNLVEVKPIVASSTWHAIKCPSTYTMTSTTLVDSARNTKGFVVSSVVREGIRKLELSWNFLSLADFSSIAQLFEGSSTGGVGAFSCYVKYFDTVVGDFIDSSNGYTTLNNVVKGSTTPREFYVGDRITDTAKIKLDSNNQPIGYVGVKLSLIEK